ncbi:dihydroorotate dehydrogenase electron transfer subunit [Paramaledivibacter caminithermalis]|uniref:Dihydroorotate dehydrogenase B (NAD(+)), electron transfer subunit n=1 Tax=Paramaledivibacter caminithermalis (strain DSM 15212 / CIP 107654 / DViRD3) TaxID=1121301 RepID=A0A1M6TN35_PARC5|nr:dihydroorotate dehydrogenase electron transfer subunit [Paramaledivibacter caminithermalis]SHK58462.1 dihydroorotate dehydrogenase electron transfer subunit [Paramaledivibacter caminithermalis DSM 15212]
MKKKNLCEILENEKIADNIYRIKIKKPSEDFEIMAGQFLNIKCGEGDFPLLRRPISIGLADKDSMTIYVNKVGKGTEFLCNREKGEFIDILGPLGNTFNMNIEKGNVLVVGGGIGVAPLLELTKTLSSKSDVNIKVILGYRDEPFIVEEFKKYTKDIIVVSEKEGFDYKGYVTKPLEKELKETKYDEVFACGPEPMLKSVNEICKEKDIVVQLLLEERMACGIGACLVCTCKTKKGNDDWKYVRTCKEGPVFYGKEVIFDE